MDIKWLSRKHDLVFTKGMGHIIYGQYSSFAFSSLKSVASILVAIVKLIVVSKSLYDGESFEISRKT